MAASHPKVLILYTGGTFGMVRAPGQGLRMPDVSSEALERGLKDRVPELADLADARVRVLYNRDSAHIGPVEWLELARTIRSAARGIQGVVLLHGTDTLAYTASALSFLLRPCPVPVILTGAQMPLSSLRTDARRNLISAVEIAAEKGKDRRFRRVMVFFNDQLLQGSRARKRSASEFDAFESPQAPPLAEVGTAIRYQTSPPALASTRPSLKPAFSPRVGLLHVTPGFPAESVREGLLPGLDALVLVIFPSGTAPTHEVEFLRLLRAAREQGKPVIVTTEGTSRTPGGGALPETYEAGRRLLAEGCLWAGELTPECAYVKAALGMGQPGLSKDPAAFGRYWRRELADEGRGR